MSRHQKLGPIRRSAAKRSLDAELDIMVVAALRGTQCAVGGAELNAVLRANGDRLSQLAYQVTQVAEVALLLNGARFAALYAMHGRCQRDLVTKSIERAHRLALSRMYESV